MKTPQQLPLALRYPPDQRLDTFVTPPSTGIARLEQLLNGGDWIYLQGASGVGKTHLALGCCAEAETRGLHAHYLPVTAMAGHLGSGALPSPQPNAFYAIDGLDAIAGQRDEEIALFHFHNAAHDARARVLYTARNAPDGLGLSLPDLLSRLEQCSRLSLALPDDATRALILQQRAERRGVQFDDAAIDWLLRHESRDLTRLTGIFEQLDKAALAAKRRLTLPFLRQVLAAGN